MRCGMCETHVNDVVRRVEGVKKVVSSHAKGRTEVIAEDGVDILRIKARSPRRAILSAISKVSHTKSTDCFRARGECNVCRPQI